MCVGTEASRDYQTCYDTSLWDFPLHTTLHRCQNCEIATHNCAIINSPPQFTRCSLLLLSPHVCCLFHTIYIHKQQQWIGQNCSIQTEIRAWRLRFCDIMQKYKKSVKDKRLSRTPCCLIVCRAEKIECIAINYSILSEMPSNTSLTLSLPSSKSIISQPFIEKCISDAMRFW